MSKLDALKRSAGVHVAESAARREGAALPAATVAALNPARMEGVARSKTALEVPLERIERDPEQPREEFDDEALDRLAGSIRARGLLQPIRVRWDEERGRYVLIAGERRWRAAQRAGLTTLTCIVDDGAMSAAERLAVQVTENLLREDLTPIEKARAYRTLMDLNGWSGNQLARELGVAQSGVVQALALLELPEPIQAQVDRGVLAPSVAYEVSRLPGPEAQAEVVARVVDEGLSRSEAVEAVRRQSRGGTRRHQGPAGAPRKSKRKVTSWARRTANGCRVTVERGRGLDDAAVEAALDEALARLRADRAPRDEAA